MRKAVLLATAAIAVSILAPLTAHAYTGCSDSNLEAEITKLYDDGPGGKAGYHIIDFTDETSTKELPYDAEGTVTLSCKANVELNVPAHVHMLYNIEVHNNGKEFIGLQLFAGKYEPQQTQTPSYSPQSLEIIPPSSDQGLSFLDGAHDRQVWEVWFNGLSGEERDGAYYWVAQRSLSHPGSCARLGGQGKVGCSEARVILEKPDFRRKIDPLYKAGWNSVQSNS